MLPEAAQGPEAAADTSQRLREGCPAGDVATRTDSSTSGFSFLFLQYRVLARGPLARGCIFTPSCSVYAEAAIGTYGPLAGTALALDRWTRCHPHAIDGGRYPLEGGRASDPVEPVETEVLGWGRSLLPF